MSCQVHPVENIENRLWKFVKAVGLENFTIGNQHDFEFLLCQFITLDSLIFFLGVKLILLLVIFILNEFCVM